VGKQHHLDRDYTVFGRITDGLEVARRISAAPCRDNGGRPLPLEDILIERITIEKKPKKTSSDPNQED
jgi:cyclophilin family peptidyl-prolyl cis-trans isomerase